MQRLIQALLDRSDDKAANGACVAKAHFGFRRVDVDVDFARVALEEKDGDRVPVGGQEIEISRAQRAGERLVAHRPPIDEQELLGSVRPAEGRQADAAGEPHAIPARVERDRVRGKVVAQGLAQPLGKARFALSRGGPVERGADIGLKREARVRRSHREPPDRVGRGQPPPAGRT